MFPLKGGRGSAEQFSYSFNNSAHSHQFYFVLLRVESLHIMFRDEDATEAQLLRLCDSVLYASNGPNFSAQSYLASHTYIRLNGHITVTR